MGRRFQLVPQRDERRMVAVFERRRAFRVRVPSYGWQSRTSAVVGTARHLAVAARTRRYLLWIRAGSAGTRPALAGVTVEQACRYVLAAPLASRELSPWKIIIYQTRLVSRIRALGRVDERPSCSLKGHELP